MTLDNILEEIKKANSIVILTHQSPDGDAIGSSLAFYIALKQMGKNPDLIVKEMPRVFKFLPYADEIKTEKTIDGEYDLAIALDCATEARIDAGEECFENAKVTISIDHHESNKMFAEHNFVNPAAPACAQILIGIFEYIGIDITKEIGTCILTGIITDTGGFKYSTISPETFEFTANLLERGVDVSEIYKQVLQIKTKAHFKLSQMATSRLEFLEDEKVTFTYITKEDEEKVNAEPGDHEGIVELGRDIEGVEVAILLRETDEGFKASLRSNGNINVSDICMMFGGGGHPAAAGCTLSYSLEDAKQKIIAQVKANLH